MKLYVNGDSHSAGHDAGGPKFSYGQHLANHYAAEFICAAQPGCSNDTIIRTTLEFLQNNSPDLVIIGWSTWEREEWEWFGQKYHVTASGADSVPIELKEKYKQWVIDSTSNAGLQLKEDLNHQKIRQLHLQLKEQNVKHLFFNCYSWFFYTQAYQRPKFNWGKNYIDPYSKEMTYYFWLENAGFKPSNPTFYHYGADAHQAWAQFLIPYIDQI